MSETLQEAIAQHNLRVERARNAREAAREVIRQGESNLTLVLESLLDQLENYESGITWETTCTHCARLWDQNYKMHDALYRIEGIAAAGRKPIHEVSDAVVPPR